jgi:antitoxin component of RelBE/YafQ-DinJ toxin-antitoxin module
MRNRIRESLEKDRNAPIANPKKYRFVKQDEMPPEYRKVHLAVSLTLPTYHRIAEVMAKHQCGMSDAVEAMLQDVEAQRVMPLDPNWKDKYSTKKKTLWQSFDLYRTAGLRKRKHTNQ